MEIKLATAKKLIAQGAARCEGHCIDNNRRYAIITRYDTQATDHARDEGRALGGSKK